LTDQDYSSFSAATKEYLFEDKENNCFKLLSLKYHTPPPRKPGEKTKELGNDQKYQNVMFMKECKAVWINAKKELENRLVDYIAVGLKNKNKKKQPSYEFENKKRHAIVLNCSLIQK
jgi:hypothetical protein